MHSNERRNGHRLSMKWAQAATNHLSSCRLRKGGVLLGLCIY